jgi:hypothetical protein
VQQFHDQAGAAWSQLVSAVQEGLQEQQVGHRQTLQLSTAHNLVQSRAENFAEEEIVYRRVSTATVQEGLQEQVGHQQK